MRPLSLLIIAGLLATTAPARAEVSEPDKRADDAFDFMNLLTRKGLHDLRDERWNVYGQFTYISSWKRPFSAAYSNLAGSTNSLSPEAERSFTGTLTFFAGLRLWEGAELYAVPEVISERPLSGLTGLGGVIQNFELQKQGTATPLLYLSRVYLRQTINLGGLPVAHESNPSQLGSMVDSRRLVFTAGNFSILDFFDKNAFAGDLRRQYLNMAFLSYAAYDFAADARGYAWGGMAELFLDDWSVRFGRFTPPKHPNQLPLDFRLDKHYGDQIEVAHDHEIAGLPGAVRVLGYRNQEVMGRFADAIAAFRADPSKNAATCTDFAYSSTNAGAPDLCWARKPNVKMGVGINLEQRLPGDIGLFARGMISDGKTEVYSYTSTDRSLSVGALAHGTLWERPRDLAGLGYGVGWISAAHAEFLGLGGVDGFLGDGRIRQATERVLNAFYSVNIFSSVWIGGDYQRISNPGYNADRGPVTILGARVHAEF